MAFVPALISRDRGGMRRRGLVVLAVLVLAAAGVIAVRVATTTAGTPLTLATAPASTGDTICPLARLVPVTVGHLDGRLVFRTALGDELPLVWPHGYSARLVDGVGELLDANGSIVARDGDTLSGIGGGGDPFTICSPS